MSDFKIVCGTKPNERTILNFEKIIRIEFYNTSSVVFHLENYEKDIVNTDLTTLEQVLKILSKARNEVVFSIKRLIEIAESDATSMGMITLDDGTFGFDKERADKLKSEYAERIGLSWNGKEFVRGNL